MTRRIGQPDPEGWTSVYGATSDGAARSLADGSARFGAGMKPDWMEWHLLQALRELHGPECHVDYSRVMPSETVPAEPWWAWWPDHGLGQWYHTTGRTAVEALVRALGLEELRNPLVDPLPGDVVMHRSAELDVPQTWVVVSVDEDEGVVVVHASDSDLLLDRIEIAIPDWQASARESWVVEVAP